MNGESLQKMNLDEKLIDGASLVHPTIEAHNCTQLRRWLNCHGRPQNGNKSELLERVKNALRNKIPVDPGLDKGKRLELQEQNQNCPSTSSLKFPDTWQKFPSNNLPKTFNEACIYDYLISSFIIEKNTESSDEESEKNVIDYSTAKPLERGKLYVDSKHIFDVYDSITSSNIYCLKCKIRASYKVKIIYPVYVMINPINGKIIKGTCECKASSLGRCAHVAALLHILLMKCKESNSENLPSTSKLCVWNRGSCKKKAHKADFPYALNKNRKSAINKISTANTPIKSDFQKTYKFVQELENFNKQYKQPSIWELLITPDYEEYELSLKRKSILRTQVFQLTASIYKTANGPSDLTDSSQCENEKWWKYRKILITASKIKYLSKERNKEQVFNWVKNHMWVDKKFDNVALKYGRDNEELARNEYIKVMSRQFGFEVSNSGLWVNPRYPGIGASPDGLVNDVRNNSLSLIEIKCPKILESLRPFELNKLTERQKSSFCCTLQTPMSMKLKRNHQYYYQIQTQMAITERQWCDFVVWTPKGIHIERIKYDGQFIETILKKISIIYLNILAPEYFEMRVPRNLIPFDLSVNQTN